MNREPSRPSIARGLLLVGLTLGGCTPPPATTEVAKPIKPTAVKAFDPKDVPAIRFTEITQDAGITFRHTNGATGRKLLPETMGSGVAFIDYDGDGDPDLFFANSMPFDSPGAGATQPTQALYRNDGKGHFEDVTKAAGLDRTLMGMGVAVGDHDNDGHPDLYLTALGKNVLFRNEGNGHFQDVTESANAAGGEGWTTSAAFFDMENDGDLDLFFCRYVNWTEATDQAISTQLLGTGNGVAYDPPSAYGGSHCVLLRNDGGKFTDVSEAAGIHVVSPDRKVPVAKSLGVAPYDIDGDGLVDLAVANDTVTNFLFHNLGKGKFEEIGVTTGIALDEYGSTRAAMGIDWADFKNDGSLGLAIGNYANEMTALYVTEKPKRLLFSDLAKMYGLGAPTQPPLKFGLFFFDYDLDGRSDLLSTNGHLESDIEKVQASETYAQAAQLFWNTGKPGRTLFVLADASKVGPDLFRPIVGRGSAYADIDGDGDLDVVMTENGGPAHLFRNEGGSVNHWIRLDLQGQGATNRDAIGAKVAVKAGGRTTRLQLFPAKGYLSSVEHPLTFGLGRAERVDELRIEWPSGRVETRTDVPADRLTRIVETGTAAPGQTTAP